MTPSVPKAGQTIYGNLLKSADNKCFVWNNLQPTPRSLLNLVALGFFDSYKIDYGDKVSRIFVWRDNDKSAPVAAQDEMIVAGHENAYLVISSGSFDAETRGSGTG